MDASFISLKILLPVVKKWFAPLPGSPLIFKENGERWRGAVALIKPQFEAGKKDVARGDGVIRDAAIHRQILLDVLAFAQGEGFNVRGLIRSPLLGPKGNAEFLAWLGFNNGKDIQELIEACFQSESKTSATSYSLGGV